MNRRDQLHSFFMRALETPEGIILRITGGGPGRRQSAVASLTTLKRELAADIPELLDIQIKAVPAREDEIAIIKLQPFIADED